MGLDVQLRRESFDLVVERSPNLTHRFYEILFERYPQTQEMFPPHRRERQGGARMIAHEPFYRLAPANEARNLREFQAGQCHGHDRRLGLDPRSGLRQIVEPGNATPPAQELETNVPSLGQCAAQSGASQKSVDGVFTFPRREDRKVA